MDYSEWAKKNKKAIAREFIRKTNFQTSDEPTGIITAGLPGAGKTEFTVQLLTETAGNPLRIDMDEIAQLIQGYRPEIADKFRQGASEILNRIYDEVIKHKIDFVLDGTFGSSKAIDNIERALKHGYKLKVYYIHQDPKRAWKFTKAREIVEHRSIDRDRFIETYYSLHKNLTDLCEKHKDVTISIIVKDAHNKVGQIIEDVPNFSQSIPEIMSKVDIESVIV